MEYLCTRVKTISDDETINSTNSITLKNHLIALREEVEKHRGVVSIYTHPVKVDEIGLKEILWSCKKTDGTYKVGNIVCNSADAGLIRLNDLELVNYVSEIEWEK